MSDPAPRSLPGPLAAVVGAVRAHPAISFALGAVLLGLLVMRLVTPPLADVRDALEGDCFAGNPLTITGNRPGEVNTVPGYATGIQRVACAEPHIWESLGLAMLGDPAGAPYPVDAIQAKAADACAERFAAFVGRPLADSELSATAFFPIRDDWEVRGERRVACLAVDPSAPTVTGSLQGADR